MNISRDFFRVSKEEVSLIIGNILYLLAFTTGLLLIITLISLPILKYYFPFSSMWIWSLPLISGMSLVFLMSQTVLRNEGKALKFGFFEVSQTIVNTIITLISLIMMNFGWRSQAIGLLMSNAIFCFVGLYYLKKNDFLTLRFNKQKIREILELSVPMIPHVVGGVILTLSDRFFIEKMVGIGEVGLYSVGYNFGMIVLLLTNSFIKAWSPWFYKILSNPTQENKYRVVKYSVVYIILLFFSAIFLGITGKYILPFFVDKSFSDSAQFIFWISMGYAMFGTYQLFFPYLILIKRTRFLAISTSISTISNLILNYYLIGYYGAIGAAYATFVSYFIMCIFVFVYTQKHYPMPWLSFTFKK
jgi:O-antigen/teichoic acid export membrane protein